MLSFSNCYSKIVILSIISNPDEGDEIFAHSSEKTKSSTLVKNISHRIKQGFLHYFEMRKNEKYLIV